MAGSALGRWRYRIAVLTEALGGAAQWGLQVRDRYVYVEPDVFCERLAPRATSVLDRLLQTTDVEQLPGVVASDLMTGPPEEFPFTPEIRRRLRLLGGLADT